MADYGVLAVDGGSPVIAEPVPSGVSGASVVGAEEIAALTELLTSQKLFRYREDGECNLFEREVAEYLGVEHALTLSSGTSALICAMIGVGLGPGDEAIVPGYTYMATPSAVIAAGAVPVIAEIDESLGLDPEDLERKITPHTKAVVPVHMRGVPSRMDEITAVARRHGLRVIEDCSQCVGGRYRGAPVGTGGDVGAWSLNYFKTLTSGEGGLLFTNDREVFERACYASEPGVQLWSGEDARNLDLTGEGFPGQTYRPSELVGAMARVQLRRLPEILSHQRSLKAAFLDELDEPMGYDMQHVDDPEGETGVSASAIVRDEELAGRYAVALQAEGVTVGTIFNKGIPDRHIYSYWDPILEKRSAHPTGYPWNDPSYRGDVEYSKDMCPQTLSILSRSLLFDFNMNMSEDHARLMARALSKVDLSLGR